MRHSLLLVLVACSKVHTGGVSVADEQARSKARVAQLCSVTTGIRQQTCLQIGAPRAPERHAWETATWWLYETRTWEVGSRGMHSIGAQIVCTFYVAFTATGTVQSDEQCRRVKRYEPWPLDL